MKFAYFGSSKVSIYVLEEMVRAGFTPDLIVTTPDKPQGRGLVMTPNIMKTWAIDHGVRFYEPAKLDQEFIAKIRDENCDLFIVASYGKILPEEIVFMPKHKTLNMHPSLLPKYRGAAPLPTTMLEDTKETGVAIMRMDEKMDHGPIVATKNISIKEWPTYEEFEEVMAREGGRLLSQILPDWLAGKIPEKEQDHSAATLTRKIKKGEALIDLNADSYLNFRKIQAYHEWPQAYFFVEKNGKQLRVKIKQASWQNGKLTIEKVVPEGGKEMSYSDFIKGYGDPARSAR